MTEADFDRCPSCGSLGQFGLRCHPKFSVKVGINGVRMEDGGHPELTAFYAHDLVSFKVLVDWLKTGGNFMVMETQKWDPRLKAWIEIFF